MRVKLFDEAHEKDLEESINKFLEGGKEIVDIKYQVALSFAFDEQIYCFSALVMYK